VNNVQYLGSAEKVRSASYTKPLGEDV